MFFESFLIFEQKNRDLFRCTVPTILWREHDMKLKQHTIKIFCCACTKILGHKGCERYFVPGQTIIDLLDEAFEKPSTGEYEYHILDDLEKWLGHYDQYKCMHFAHFLNARFCCDITTEEILECLGIDGLADLLDRHTGYFFPKYCKHCVDKTK